MNKLDVVPGLYLCNDTYMSDHPPLFPRGKKDKVTRDQLPDFYFFALLRLLVGGAWQGNIDGFISMAC